MAFRKGVCILGCLAAVLAVAALVALLAGEYAIDPEAVFSLVWGKITGNSADIGRAQEVIVWRIRIPRLLLAAATGVSLSVSGAAYQGCFKNPLVEPYILGVSSGAACGAALAIVFPSLFPSVQITAFILALAAVLIAHSLARSGGQTPPVALVLSGIIVGALFSAGVGIVKYVAADTQLREITFWMMGGLYYATWSDATLNLLVAVPALFLLWRLGWNLNILSLGDEEARSLGLNPSLNRLGIILVATLAAAVSVATTGIIAWVGLMTPHAARMLFGPDNRWVMPGAALLGAIYILVCDTIARTLIGSELPMGIVTSTVGAPYLLWLIRSRGKVLYGV